MAKKILMASVLISAGLLYFLYIKGYIFANFENLTPRQAHEMIRNDPDAVVLDVRTPQEYAEGHLRGATLVPVQVIDQALGEGKLEPLKGKKIIVYCRSGVRSVKASRKLADHGFVPYNVKGGINAWKSEGLPVVR